MCRTFLLATGTDESTGQLIGIHDRLVDLAGSFIAALIEQQACEQLRVTTEAFQMNPREFIRAARSFDGTRPIVDALDRVGSSNDFVALGRRIAVGRKFFRTAQGRIGMSAVEELPDCGDVDESHISADSTCSQEAWEPFLEPFSDDTSSEGVRKGDLVVLMARGWTPYVLRPVHPESDEQEVGSTSPVLLQGGEYSFVGECYVDGVMRAEPFVQARRTAREEDSEKSEGENGHVHGGNGVDEGYGSGGEQGFGEQEPTFKFDVPFVRIVIV